MIRTGSIPTELAPERFLPLMKPCAEMFNADVDWSLEKRTCHKTKAHHALSAPLRQAVPSALIQPVRDTALEAVKATRFARHPRKKPTSSLGCDPRTIRLRGDQLTLACIGPRARTILQVPDDFRAIFESWDFQGATLSFRRRTGSLWLPLVCEGPTPEKQPVGETQGIDRGWYHLAVRADGRLFSKAELRSVQRRWRTLQAKGFRSVKRRLMASSGREQRFSRDVNGPPSRLPTGPA